MPFFYHVAPTAVVRANEGFLTYHSEVRLATGTLVRVSVGHRILNGVVIGSPNSEPKFKTKSILDVINEHPLPKPLVELANWMSEYYATHLAVVLQTILPAGLNKQRRQGNSTSKATRRKRTQIVLNKDQRAALSVLSSGSGTYLLHGVTGSGKTQIYIEAARKQLEQGRSCVILVPEISLTPQLVAEFANHFSNLLLTHSGLTEAERHKIWLQALITDTPSIAIGPRSALFMPLKNLGLIVVDECHEPSYKQDQSPRYSALRTASVLAKLHNAKVVFGSATPSIADYFLAKTTKNPILKLEKPAVNTIPPTILTIDSRKRADFTRHRFLSNQLLDRIQGVLADNKQALIFHNRRGSASTTVCENCGWLAECPNCHLPLTLHADLHKLKCHLCGQDHSVPPSCPSCNEPTVTFKGIGTKLIEAELAKIFPKARIGRFDADTTKKDAAHNRYQDLYDGNIDIIIGTQMLAKGFDLPKLALVGVIQADSGLIIPDYQSDERVFQLIYQVVGRIGRQNHGGHAIIQTFNPEHPAIAAAIKRDYPGFYSAEIQKRKIGGFPPYRYLLKLTCAYRTEKSAIAASQKMAKFIQKNHTDVEILGPTPAFYEHLNGNYRWQIVVKSTKRSVLAKIAEYAKSPWQFDIDPSSLL